MPFMCVCMWCINLFQDTRALIQVRDTMHYIYIYIYIYTYIYIQIYSLPSPSRSLYGFVQAVWLHISYIQLQMTSRSWSNSSVFLECIHLKHVCMYVFMYMDDISQLNQGFCVLEHLKTHTHTHRHKYELWLTGESRLWCPGTFENTHTHTQTQIRIATHSWINALVSSNKLSGRIVLIWLSAKPLHACKFVCSLSDR